MKFWLVAACLSTFGAIILASPLSGQNGNHLVGAKECTWGPTHWCANFQNSKKCHATKHCIQTVWQHQQVPEDTDSVCQICLDMVKQARDQLESNQTQDDLRDVFEGSCKLIHVKPIVNECIKIVDDFIPQLVEALASQMNPQVVCSVAGLCNSAKIDKMLEDYENSKKPEKSLTCQNCENIASKITSKFHGTSRDDVLENMLQVCGRFSSISDACSSIIITYFNEIYENLENNLDSGAICHLSGSCVERYHQHPEIVEIRPMGDVGVVSVNGDPDIPCELCEQLVNHLRDLLVANTTEAEFKQVLEGLCRQTKGFKDECVSIVDQYYAEIYEFMTKNLSPNEACFYIGICPKGFGAAEKSSILAPIVPVDLKMPAFYKHKKILGENEPILSQEEIHQAQLPIDTLMGAPNRIALVEGGSWCTMCEYVLHFLQEELSNAKNEEQIKQAVLNVCHKMPSSISAECDNFVQLYSDAIIALLIQEVDPAAVCPKLKLCPDNMEKDTEVFAPSQIHVQVHSEASNKASCPLCLLAVQQAKTVIQEDKSVDKIKKTLENLCNHLNNKLKMECNDFVETYSKELIQLLMKDFTPQEICVYLKLCTDQRPDLSLYGISLIAKDDKGHNIETNEISDNTIDGILISTNPKVEFQNTPECMLCQEVVKEVEKNVVNKHSKADIKRALERACNKVPKKIQAKCNQYIEQHGDQIIELIMEEMSPKEICRDLELCVALEESELDDLEIDDAVQVTVFASPNEAHKDNRLTGDIMPEGSQTCIVCEMIITRMDKDLAKPATQEEVKQYLENVCKIIPSRIRADCNNFIETYGSLIVQAIESIPPKKICEQIGACLKTKIKSKEEIVECAVCEGCVTSLETFLKDKVVDDEIEKLLEKSCHSVPARYYERCMKMVKVYGISIIEQLKTYPESHNVCAEIGMCYRDQSAGFVSNEDAKMFEPPVVTKKPFLVGENECTWGPSHWCKDEETATKCKSLEYCKDKKVGQWSA